MEVGQPDPQAVAPIVSIRGLTKTYTGGFQALKEVNLNINRGEIFALLGPNGAGKTTLISIICGLTRLSSGEVRVNGHDIARDFRAARRAIGLVPQELSTDAFETVWSTLTFSRGLFGCPQDPALLEQILRDLTLWDKRHEKIMTLSGGMKRRVLIAKALAHEPQVLFLDEPTAGVDVDLRKDMWALVHRLRASGVTIILTTHYIEEAEEMADRVGIINRGEIILVEAKDTLMHKLGQKRLTLQLSSPLHSIPSDLARPEVSLEDQGNALVYTFNSQSEDKGISTLLRTVNDLGIEFTDLQTQESSLEEIFVNLVRSNA